MHELLTGMRSKVIFLTEVFVLWSMGNELVPSPLQEGIISMRVCSRLFLPEGHSLASRVMINDDPKRFLSVPHTHDGFFLLLIIHFHICFRILKLLVAIPEYAEIIRIHHECEGGIEKSVSRVTDWHHEACRVMTNVVREGRIFFYHIQPRIMNSVSCSPFNTAFYV